MAAPMQDCIVLFGDSLTQRMDTPGSLSQWMHEKYSRRLDVINRGFGGYNSEWARPLFDKIFARREDATKVPVVRMVTIWFGTNDSVLPMKEQHVSLERFLDNMNYFLTSLTSPDSPYAVADTPVSIILITPGPPLHSQMGFSQMAEPPPHFRTIERTGQFRDAVLQIGNDWKLKEKEQNLNPHGRGWKIETIDLWAALEKAGGGLGEGLAPFMIDGVHFSTLGYEVLWREMERVIRVDLKGRGLDFDDQEDLPFRVPWWSDIDPSDTQSVVDRMTLPKFRGGEGRQVFGRRKAEG